MKIKFKKNRLYGNLLLGVVWFGIGLLHIYDGDRSGWSYYVYSVLGLLYIGHFLNDIMYQYLTIEKGIIRRNKLYGFGNKINLSDINWIKKDNRSYTLVTESTKMKIKTKLIEENSLNELDKLLGGLNLPSDKTPFAESV